jgi:hypothetical protein
MNFRFIPLVVLMILSASIGHAAVDDRLYAKWQFSGCSFDDGGKTRTSTVDGEIQLTKDGQCRGQRKIGAIYGPLDGAFTVSGDRLSLKAEPDITYTWGISEGEIKGKPVWVLALNNGSMVYQLVRPR